MRKRQGVYEDNRCRPHQSVRVAGTPHQVLALTVICFMLYDGSRGRSRFRSFFMSIIRRIF